MQHLIYQGVPILSVSGSGLTTQDGDFKVNGNVSALNSYLFVGGSPTGSLRICQGSVANTTQIRAMGTTASSGLGCIEFITRNSSAGTEANPLNLNAGSVNMPSLGSMTSNDVLVVDGSGNIGKKKLMLHLVELQVHQEQVVLQEQVEIVVHQVHQELQCFIRNIRK